MNIRMIVAKSENGVIGNNGEIPWHYPGDLHHFKTSTMGGSVIMGRNTFESPGPLPGREIIVLTTSKDYPDEDVKVARDIQEALDKATNEDVWICGGEGVYEEYMGIADEIVMSLIPEEVEGDTYFPEVTDDYYIHEQRTVGDFDVVTYRLKD